LRASAKPVIDLREDQLIRDIPAPISWRFTAHDFGPMLLPNLQRPGVNRVFQSGTRPTIHLLAHLLIHARNADKQMRPRLLELCRELIEGRAVSERDAA